MGIKRYWAFCGQDYYPTGGMFDGHASFDTIDEAIAWSKDRMENGEPVELGGYKPSVDWAHVWDMQTDVEVGRYYRDRKPGTEEYQIVWVAPEEEES